MVQAKEQVATMVPTKQQAAAMVHAEEQATDVEAVTEVALEDAEATIKVAAADIEAKATAEVAAYIQETEFYGHEMAVAEAVERLEMERAWAEQLEVERWIGAVW